jgi:hypothetical protein
MIGEGDTWKKSLKEKQAPLHALTSYVFHLVIRYKKDIYDKVADMLSRPIVSASVIFKYNIILHESYVEKYALDADFKYVYATFCRINQVEELDSYVHGKLLYHGKLCFSQGERVNMIRKAHYSLVANHFGVGKMVASLQRKHPNFLDEHLHYFQHAYNRAKHSLTQTPPFEACFGYLPKFPLDLSLGNMWLLMVIGMLTRRISSLNKFSLCIKWYKNSWKITKPSTRQDMTSFVLVLKAQIQAMPSGLRLER